VGGGGTDVGERPMPLRPCTIARHTVTHGERENTVSLRFSLPNGARLVQPRVR
jgi:hypothetical protein